MANAETVNKNNEGYALVVDGLRTCFHTLDGKVVAVDNVSYKVRPGEIIGIVGESGCGKSVSQYSVMQLIEKPAGHIEGGHVIYDGKDLLSYKPDGPEMRSIRGNGISIIFQEPMTALNPVLTVGRQLTETIELHLGLNKADAKARAIELLKMVGIPDPQSRINYYPYQFSGGMCQRIMIAMAIACDPKVLIADEATTALDVTTQEQILDLIQDIAKKTGTAVIMITHDLGVVARYAERIYVMYAGRVIESGSTEDIFYRALHPYTKGLLRAVPRMDSNKENKLISIDGVPPRLINKPEGCDFCPRCMYANEECKGKPFPETVEAAEGHIVACHRFRQLEGRDDIKADPILPSRIDYTAEPILKVEDLVMKFPAQTGLFEKKRDLTVLDGVTFNIWEGETVGLVGESGCGKSTVSNCIMRFYEPSGGKITFMGKDITHMSKRELHSLRKDIQIISQNPYAALDPRHTIRDAISEPLVVNKVYSSRKEVDDRVEELMNLVGLDPYMADRMPHEFSGGQRQRICIARALALNPKLLICDEPVSALDVSIQAQILNLFMDLKAKLGLSYLFVAHGLSVVRHISDRIAVMYMGQIVETAGWKEIYENPKHPYTQALLSAVPIPDPLVDKGRERISLSGEVGSIANRIDGCNFCNRCRYATEECKTTRPVLREVGENHLCACPKVK